MAWTGIARLEHSRQGLRYPSDMTDREWMLTEPFIPPARRGGRRRTTDIREVLNALLYLAASGCAWRLLPKCFPPVSTVRRYFYAWRDAGLFDAINMVLVMNLREIEGREASPSAGVIDSQSVKTTESGGPAGYDAGKKVKGRKRHILTDTCGFLVFIARDFEDISEAHIRLVAGVLVDRPFTRAHRQGRGPRPRPRAWILDRDLHTDRLVVETRVALGQVHRRTRSAIARLV